MYQFSGNSRIVLDEVDAGALSETAATFAGDLLDLTGHSIPILVGLGNRAPGDICLTLAATDIGLGAEGYLLNVSDVITISSATESGVFNGTRTVLQLLRQGSTSPRGSARDWPDYPERGLMLDVGRKYFSIPFLRRHVKELAWLKLNYLHLHLSDDQGFRIESTTHPEVVSAQHHSKADMKALVELARKYHVMVVPEIDVPAHASAILAQHPELQLAGRPDLLDLGNPASQTLVTELIEEYLPLFPAPYWHTGADEYLRPADYARYPQLLSYARQLYGSRANAFDIYIGFVNRINALVKAHGKQLRAWNDIYGVVGSATSPNSDIVLEMWAPFIKPGDALRLGHTIMNCSFVPLYYVLGRPGSTADPANLYLRWRPNLQWPGNVDLPEGTPGVRGGKFHVWCDFPDAETEDQVQDHLAPYLPGLAQNNWGALNTRDWNVFLALSEQIGRAPGLRRTLAVPAMVFFQMAAGARLPDPHALPVSSTAGDLAFKATVSGAGSTPVFVRVEPAEGRTPATLSVRLMEGAAALAPGAYTNVVTLTSPEVPGAMQTVTVSLEIFRTDAPLVTSVRSGASLQPGAVSPGEIVSVFGWKLAPGVAGLQLTPDGRISTTVMGARLLVNGVPASLTYVSANQINAIVPYEIEGATSAAFSVVNGAGRSVPVSVNVGDTAPAVFAATQTGKGQGAILNADLSINSAANPAARGSTIALWATGEGLLTPRVATGSITGAGGESFPRPTAAVSLAIGGQPAAIVYAGAAPGLPSGILQVNAIVPPSIGAGDRPVVLTIGRQTSSLAVTVAVK